MTTPVATRPSTEPPTVTRPPVTDASRWWHLVFAGFSVLILATVLPLPGSPMLGIRVLGTLGYGVAIAVSVITFARPNRFVSRRHMIGFHLVFAPLQFLISFAAPMGLGLVGIALSTVVLARMRPQFAKLSRRARKYWLTAHVGVSVGWLGLSLAMTTLAVVGLSTTDAGLRHGAYRLMHVFDLVIVIPTVVLAIITGLVVSLGTPWGLVKHRWVLLKFVIAVSIPGIATVQSRWIMRLIDVTENGSADPGALGVALVACMVVYAILLWTATALSVFKPGGRTRWGRPSTSKS